jgi:hypothetical protein
MKEPTQGIYGFVLINKLRSRKKIVGVFYWGKSTEHTFVAGAAPAGCELQVRCTQNKDFQYTFWGRLVIVGKFQLFYSNMWFYFWLFLLYYLFCVDIWHILNC